MKTKRPRVALFFGGTSANNDLSEETGYWMCQYIPRSEYEVSPIRILPDGRWQVPLGSLPRYGPVDNMMHHLFEAVPAISPQEGLARMMNRPLAALMTVIRGKGGDDGAMNGISQMWQIPVVGSSLPAYQQTNDKFLCGQTLQDVAEMPESKRYRAATATDEIVAQAREHFLPPVFVKPSREDGSIGVEQISSIDELPAAVTRAKQWGDIVIQKKAEGQEVNLTLYQDRRGKITALPGTRILPRTAAYYDHFAKRRAGRVQLNTIEPDDQPAVKAAEEIARNVYQQLGCQSAVNFDLVLTPAGARLLEVNLIPSLTRFTPLVHQLNAGQVHPAQLLDWMIKQSIS